MDPECGELDRLAAARRHHQVADPGVHPGELQAFLARAHEAVGVDANPVPGAAEERVDDREEAGEMRREPRVVARGRAHTLGGGDGE
jgi:hypothetical protein